MSEFVPLSRADPSRRALLRGGVVAAGSILGAGALVDGRAVASVPRSQYFDLTQPSHDFAHPLANVAQPTDLGTFQGYTIYGEYLYLLEGDAYSNTNPPPSDCGSATIAGNSRITSVHLNTGQVQQHRVPTKAACTLSYREPEGMAIYRTVGGETRLFFGFASGGSGARRCNVLYKNALKNS